MNAMEYARHKQRKEYRMTAIYGALGFIGVILLFAGIAGLFHGFHPVPCGLVMVGIMLIEGLILRDRWERKEKAK